MEPPHRNGKRTSDRRHEHAEAGSPSSYCPQSLSALQIDTSRPHQVIISRFFTNRRITSYAVVSRTRPASQKLLSMLGISEHELLSNSQQWVCGSLRRQEVRTVRGGTCRGRGSNPHEPYGSTDFKSVASANSATSALLHRTLPAATLPVPTEPGCASAPLYYAMSRR
jgi:hypothetical protein